MIEDPSGKKILITGSSGFIGSRISKRLKASNQVRESRSKEDDLRNYESCLKLTKGMDYVFHLAANIGGIRYLTQNAAQVITDNQLIDLNILRASHENNIKRILFSSSACVYPDSDTERPIKEEDAYPATPDNYYGWEKLFMENELQAYKEQYGLGIRIARYHTIFGNVGRDDKKDKVPEALCKKAIRAKDGEDLEILGDGTPTRSFLHVDDCVDATIKLMESDYEKPVNIGSDKAVTINELADIIIKTSKKKLGKKYKPIKESGVKNRNADISVAKKVLGWEPKISLETGIKRLYSDLEAIL